MRRKLNENQEEEIEQNKKEQTNHNESNRTNEEIVRWVESANLQE